MAHRIAAALLCLALSACAPLGAPSADLVLGAGGCDRSDLTIGADRPASLSVRNDAPEPMVLSLPDWNSSLTLQPGERGELALQPFAWGSVSFYCLTERDHAAASPAMASALVCGLDSFRIRPLALSAGTIQVERRS